jgi:hypothetical protein
MDLFGGRRPIQVDIFRYGARQMQTGGKLPQWRVQKALPKWDPAGYGQAANTRPFTEILNVSPEQNKALDGKYSAWQNIS